MDFETGQRLPMLDRSFRSPRVQWSALVISVTLFLSIGYFAFGVKPDDKTRPVLPSAGADRLFSREGKLLSDEQLLAVATAPPVNQPISREDAELENARLPYSREPMLIARPFLLSRADREQYERARNCLAAAIYYEAGNESLSGRQAVAQVVLNRARHPAYPHSICGVVFQGAERATGCQFTFTCDGALTRRPRGPALDEALSIAEAALTGFVEPSVGWSTHYHARWVVPYWAPTLGKTVLIGAHYFYRIPGRLSAPDRFDAPAEPEQFVRAVTPFGARAAELAPAPIVDVSPSLVEQLLVGEGAPVTFAVPDMPANDRVPTPSATPSAVTSPSHETRNQVPAIPEPPRRRRGALPM